jgi:hypothetical protein
MLTEVLSFQQYNTENYSNRHLHGGWRSKANKPKLPNQTLKNAGTMHCILYSTVYVHNYSSSVTAWRSLQVLGYGLSCPVEDYFQSLKLRQPMARKNRIQAVI